MSTQHLQHARRDTPTLSAGRCISQTPSQAPATAAGWLHLCNGLDPERDGGMVPSIIGFTHALAPAYGRVTVVTPTPTRHDLVQFRPDVPLHGPETDLTRWVRAADLVHIHGLWQIQTRVGAHAARRSRVPYVISAHGMADPWALHHKRLKKAVYRFVVEDRNLRHAACLHALAPPEVYALRRLAPKTPIALVPNGVDLAPFDNLPQRSALFGAESPHQDRFHLLFYGRLHAKKGLDLLAKAMARLAADHPNLHILLAGRDDGARAPFLDRLRGTGLADRVTDLGHVAGERARAVWAAADAFILPSYSEGFSMAVLEALAARLPVVITTACNFQELARAEGGIVVAPNANDVENGLRQLLERSPAQRAEMAARGRGLVERSYTWPNVAARLAQIYQWILGGGPAPEALQS